MAIEPLAAGRVVGLERGAAVVCIPVCRREGDADVDTQALVTIESVLEHTSGSTPLLIAGPAERIERVEELLPPHLPERALLGLSLASSANETVALDAALRASHPGDVVLVTAGVRVTAGWLEHLQAAAGSDSTIASATPFSLGPGGVELFGDDLLGGAIDGYAQRVAEDALQLRPRIATIGPGCAYVRRAALELTGSLDESLGLDRALAEQAERLIAAGFVHVAADDVLIGGHARRAAGSGTPGSHVSSRGAGPVEETFLEDERGTLSRARTVARTALRGLSVTIDGRALTDAVGGTQTYIIELVIALARRGDLVTRVLVPPDLSARAANALAALSEVELLTYEQALDDPQRSNVVHRPQSVFTADDLTLLRLLGDRIVIGQLDLIAYHNHSYHEDIEHWRSYRRTTRLALGAADQVIFFSEHARRDALAEDLLPEGRSHVVGVGAEVIEPTGLPASAPEGMTEHEPFLLCMGADYAHKNRPFAIELLRALRELGWGGRLVLAGGHVSVGSSREQERTLLDQQPELARSVLDLGVASEPEKDWLYGHARALLYPTLYEGFGLLPLEAARADLPCLFAPQASLLELAGDAATLIPWDAGASALRVLPILTDGPQREAHLASLHALPLPAWDEVAERLFAVYRRAVVAPPSEAASRVWQELDREDFIRRLEKSAQEYQDAYHRLEARVSSGLPLIDDGGLLTRSQQRGLMRIAARRGLGSVLLGPLGLLGRGADAEAARSGEPNRD